MFRCFADAQKCVCNNNKTSMVEAGQGGKDSARMQGTESRAGPLLLPACTGLRGLGQSPERWQQSVPCLHTAVREDAFRP